MGAPAKLPGFKGLAREIAEPVIPWEAKYEVALDRYLGIAERKRVLVQERAREKLLARGGSNTPLHEHLLGIFGSADRVRLITTNFDSFFTDAAVAVFPASRIPIYIGPALPPSSGFRGLVYLHGALSAPHDRLVLTDADFGSAYLADGWAARFLVPVFANRTVLFAGYSLNDPVMQYLLQALPRTQRWFALCPESENQHWADRDIIAVPFQASAGGDLYGDLNAGMQRWSWYSQATPLNHDQELRRLVALGPPASPEDADYVRARLRTETGRRSFWGSATDEAWFHWAVKEGLLACLTDEHSKDEQVYDWAQWVVLYFCGGQSPPLLNFVRGRSLRLHSGFANALSLHLWRIKPFPPSAVLRQFIALLVNQPASQIRRFDHHPRLVEKLVNEGCTDEAMALLGWLTRVRLVEIESLYLYYEEEESDDAADPVSLPALSNRIGIAGSSPDLAEYLDRGGQSLAALAADDLVWLGEVRLREAYEFLDLARGTEGTIDWMSYGRTSIAPSNQDSFAHAEDVLVAIVRTALDYFAIASLESLEAFAEKNSKNERALLRRLALYAYAKHPTLSADELLDKAVDEGWTNDIWLRPEFYLLLKAHYDRASEGARARFIAGLPVPSPDEEAEDEFAGHARFSLSQKLKQLSPASASTVAFAEAEAALHSDWREGDKDGFLSRTEVGWGSGELSPIAAEEMLEWTGAEVVARIGAQLIDETRRSKAGALFGAVQQAARTRASWAIDVFVALLNSTEQPDGLLDSLVWGMRETPFSPEEQRSLLEACIAVELPASIGHSLGSLIDKWARELKPGVLPAVLNLFDEVADRVYAGAKAVAPGVADAGWVERAMNHPAGHAAQVWWSVANARDWVDGKFVLTLDDPEKARWETVVQDDSAAGAFARPIIGMATDRLSGGDFPWAEKTLFPAFDPASDINRAAQLWDGRLMQSRWSWTTVSALEPYMSSFLRESPSLVPARSRELGDWIGMLVANPKKSKFSVGRLHEFIYHATPEARIAFADSLPRHLSRLTPKGRETVWSQILMPYWRDRRTNVPVPLSPDEVGEMLGWVVALPENAHEVLAELMRTECSSLPHADALLWKWKEEDEWPRKHPDEAVGIVKFLAQRASIQQWSADDAVVVLELALAAGATEKEVQATAEAVAASTDCKSATALAARLRL